MASGKLGAVQVRAANDRRMAVQAVYQAAARELVRSPLPAERALASKVAMYTLNMSEPKFRHDHIKDRMHDALDQREAVERQRQREPEMDRSRATDRERDGPDDDQGRSR